MKSKSVLIAAIAVAFLAVSCTPTTTPASTTTSEVAVSTTSTSSTTTSAVEATTTSSSTTSSTTTTSPVPILVDANGVELGVPIDDGVFYNPNIKRNIAYGFGELGRFPRDARYNQVSFAFSENNCTGEIYLKAPSQLIVYTWLHALGDRFYIVPETVTLEKLQAKSQISPGSSCGTVDSASPPQDVYRLQQVNLPFSTPLAVPLYYK